MAIFRFNLCRCKSSSKRRCDGMGWAGLLLAVAVFANTSPALAQTWAPRERFTGLVTATPRSNEFSLYYYYWAADRGFYAMEYQNVPWRLDVAIINAGHLATYFNAGPHMIDRYPGGPEAYYTMYLTSMSRFFQDAVPDVSFRGLIALDYESWGPWWTGHPNSPSTLGITAEDYDTIDDWREHIRQTRPQLLTGKTPAQQEEVFRQTYLTFTRDHFTRIFNATKALRPNAKVGFYNFPTQMYWQWRDPQNAEKMRWGYENEMAWFWKMVDVIFPSVYPFYTSVPNNTPSPLPPYSDRYADYERYLTDNIAESLRHANGKPVIPFIGYQFHPSNPTKGMMPITPWMLSRSFEIPRELGCSGVVAWGATNQRNEFEPLIPFYRDVMNPFVRQFATLPSLAPTLNPPPLTAPNAPITSQPDTPSTPAPNTPPATIPPVPPELNQNPPGYTTTPTTPIGNAPGSGPAGTLPNPADVNSSSTPGNTTPARNASFIGGGGGGGFYSEPGTDTAGAGSTSTPSSSVSTFGPTNKSAPALTPAPWSPPPVVITTNTQLPPATPPPLATAVSKALKEARPDNFILTLTPTPGKATQFTTRPASNDPIAQALARHLATIKAMPPKAPAKANPPAQVITTVPTEP